MVIPGTDVRLGGWTVGSVVGRRPAGVARDAVHPGTGARAVLVVVDERFSERLPPDADLVARAATIGSPLVMPLLDAGLLDDGTRWYVTPAAPAPVLDPAAGCSPRRAATIVQGVAAGLAAVHAAGIVHGLVGPQAVVPAAGRHAGGAAGTTLLLDTGIAALLGDRAADLAAASGVSLPVDRGQPSDVHALGALLLRLLTAAAPAGPALAALPVELRGLLSAMLDEDPARRPEAAAVARSLAGLREGLLATAPVDLPQPAAPTRRPVTEPVPAPARPAALAPRPATAAVPAPVRAPITLGSPIVAPRVVPESAPSLWTGPLPVRDLDAAPARRRARTLLLVAGGVGLAGLLVGVVTHLPTTREAGVAAVAAAADGGGIGAQPAQTGDPVVATAAPTGRAKHRATSPAPAAAAPAPAFARPTTAVPSPLAASATSTTPSRNTTPPPKRGGSPAPGSSSPTSSSPVSSSPVSSTPSSSTPGGTGSSTPAESSSPTGSSTPTQSSSPSESTAPSPSETTTPSEAATPSESATPEATPSAAATPSDSPTPSDGATSDAAEEPAAG